MNGDMLVNVPKETPIRLYVRCVDDSPSKSDKPVLDWIKKNKVYVVYGFARPLNKSAELSYYIMDTNGKKIEPFDGVPTWLAERFEVVSETCMN